MKRRGKRRSVVFGALALLGLAEAVSFAGRNSTCYYISGYCQPTTATHPSTCTSTPVTLPAVGAFCVEPFGADIVLDHKYNKFCRPTIVRFLHCTAVPDQTFCIRKHRWGCIQWEEYVNGVQWFLCLIDADDDRGEEFNGIYQDVNSSSNVCWTSLF